jgi:hypothetical protein
MSASRRSQSIEEEVDALVAELDDDPFESDAHVTGGGSKRESAIPAHVPAEVVKFVGSIAWSRQTRAQIVSEADRRICRRLPRGDRTYQSRVRWERAWAHHQDDIKARLRRLRDEHVFAAHQSMADAAHFQVCTRLTRNFLPWRPSQAGALIIDDPVQVRPSFGAPAYLEPTPMKVVRYVYETWSHRRSGRLEGDVCLIDLRAPKVWDLTAGSGTVGDYLRTEGCTVIESDLTPVRDHIDCASAAQLGRIGSHTSRGGFSKVHRFVTHPDIVFIDPSSRGKPSVSRIYDGARESDDFANLPRDEWIEIVSAVARAASAFVSNGGLVSLLVRHGHRRHGKVTPDDDLLSAVKASLAKPIEGLPIAIIVSELRIKYRGLRAQTSLGRARVPATHLLLEAAR